MIPGGKIRNFISLLATPRRGVAAIVAFTVAGLLICPQMLCPPAWAENDYLIVPWERIGPITLGMSADDLLRLMGDPTHTMGGPPHTFNTLYWHDELSATINKDGAYVTQVCALSPAHATRQGVHPGSSEAAVEALLGEPQSSRVYTAFWKLSYTNLSWGGLTISIPLTGFAANHLVRTVCVNHNA